MMKFTVTEILVSYIKDIRKEKKITVTEFAHRIGKSKSYVTKFDNCEFKTLTLDDFQKTFSALYEDDLNESEKAMDNYFLLLIKEKYVEQSIDLMVDLSNYSNIVKKVNIPHNLILKMNQILKTKNFTIDKIIDCANSNESIKHYSNYNLVDYNEYVPVPISESKEPAIYIKIKLEKDYIESILEEKILVSNYFTLLAFANAIYTLETMHNNEMDQDAKNKMALILAHNLLFNFQLYALEDYFKIKQSEENIQNLSTNLGIVSHSIQSTLGIFMDLVSHIYKQNPLYTEGKIRQMDKNIKTDAAFFFASLDIPLYKVKHLNTDTKKKILKEINILLDRYANDEDYQNQLDLL